MSQTERGGRNIYERDQRRVCQYADDFILFFLTRLAISESLYVDVLMRYRRKVKITKSFFASYCEGYLHDFSFRLCFTFLFVSSPLMKKRRKNAFTCSWFAVGL